MLMKVNLNDVTLNISLLTGEVYVGVVDEDGVSWACKKDVTSNFLGCCCVKFNGNTETIGASDGSVYEIICKKVNPKIIQTDEDVNG